MVTRITSVVLAAASYDLTDLETAKEELGIDDADTSKDSWLTKAIAQVSTRIANYTSRVFPVERVSDTFYLKNADFNFNVSSAIAPVLLSRYPIIAILSITEEDIDLVEGVDFTVDYKSGELYRLSPDEKFTRAWHREPIIVEYDAGFGSKNTEARSIPGTGPFTITAAKASVFAFDEGVTLVSDGSAFEAVASGPATGQYSVNNTTGVYTFAAADAGKAILIAYSYNVPDAALEAISLRLITLRYKAKGRDPALMMHSEPQIGEDRWWVGTAPGQDGAFPPDIESELDDYKAPVLG